MELFEESGRAFAVVEIVESISPYAAPVCIPTREHGNECTGATAEFLYPRRRFESKK